MAWAPDYVTSAELKSYLRITDTADDAFIALWVTTVSRNIDDHTGRQFGKSALEDRIYEGQWDRSSCRYVYQIDDLMDVTGLEVADEDEVAVTGHVLEPRNAVAKGKPYERLTSTDCGPLTITALWGWNAVPSAVKTGMFLQGARLAARRDSPFGIAGSPSDGSELRLLAKLDPDFQTSLKPYVRKWWAA